MIVYTNGTTANYGFNIIITFTDDNNVPIDISGATTKQIVFIAPDGTATSKTASFTTDGTDGRIQYVVESTLLIKPGAWKFYGIADETASFGKSTEAPELLVILRPTV